MAASMGPPMLPGYSLRVQLFSPTAHELTDKPIRCFRVVTSPEVTIREFCEEASRIHEINYGEPLAIKKVQDDQEFDVTQSEILGNLFANTATIRVIKASANPTIRDSIPPTSALRFDPSTTRKRDRSSPNGGGSLLKPPKRQRIAELDPDQPLPSREAIPAHANGYVPEVLVPNSQEIVMTGSDARYVRPQQIEETPEPPALRYSPFYQNGNADRQTSKNNEKRILLRENSARAQSHGSSVRAKSASYHIQRATERGTSVSTAATSPPSVEGQRGTVNGHGPASKWKGNEGSYRSLNEDNIYDNIVSEDEGAKPLKTKRLSLKARNSPGGLPGIEWAKAKTSNTPPSIGRRSTASREPPTTPGELPLTPSSKEREARRQERKEQEEARKGRLAAAEAAEQRQREAEEARLEEERRVAEAERAQREEEEARQVEEFNRAEAERRAKAEKLRKENEAREAREAEEARIAKVEAERRRKETEVALRRAEENRQEEIRVAGKEKATAKSEKKDSATPDSRQKASSPILPRSASRAQSSTPHIPKGKPNGLKSILKSSSPARPSPEQSSNASNTGNGVQSVRPRQRTISFDFEVEPAPIRPGTRIVPPKSSTPKAKTPIQPPKRSVASKVVPQPPKGSPAPSSKRETLVPSANGGIAERSASPMIAKNLVPHSTSAIVPPARISPIPPPPRKISSIKPMPSTPIQPPAVNEKPKSTAKPNTVVISDESEDSDEESVEDEDVEMADAPIIKKENHSPANTRVIQDSLEEDAESESSASGDEDVEMAEAAPEKEQTSTKPKNEGNKQSAPKNMPNIPSKPTSTIHTPHNVIVISSAEESEEEDFDATQSHNSSPRESRSPVIFSQNPPKAVAAKFERLPLLESEEDEQSDNEATPRAKTNPSFLQESTVTTDSESSEEEGGHVLVPKSSPPLPRNTRKTVNSGPAMSQVSNKSQMNTQTEVDNQLTSSLSRPHSSGIPASSIANRPPAMKFGASLSSLSQQKNLIGTSSQTKVKPSVNGLRKTNNEESESEEESDESSTSSEDGDLHVPVRAPVTPKRKQKVVEEDSDSTSTSDSDEEKEKSDSQRVRDELSKRIASVMASSEKSSKKVIGTQSASKLYGKERKDKYLTGYSFSQPGI